MLGGKELMLERLQKIISAAGITSRRAAEELIREGRVRVNGKVVTELGTKADATKDHIKVDGKLINPKQPPTYIMLNKPVGFVTTMSDPEGRRTVQDLLKGIKVRVYPVGRLDYNTEGLLLMTNDGDFAHLITHPKHEFPKTYLTKVKGVVEESQIDNLEKGIYLDDGKTAPAKIKKIRKEEANSWLEITIHEGRKRQVRRMFDRVGHSVIKLKRIRTGNLSLGDLPEGSYRYLTPVEVQALREASEKTDVRIQKPASRSRKPEVRNTDEKTAHRGRTLDLRPGRAIWSEERKQGPGAKGPRSRVQGQGSRGTAPRQGTKTELRSSSPGPKGQGQGSRSTTPRQGTKTEWRSSNPRSRVQGQGSRSTAPRQGTKTEWRSSSPRPRAQSQGPGSSKPRPGMKTTKRRPIPKTMIHVERPSNTGPRKNTSRKDQRKNKFQ
jgi:23S rRNA pseudouridine2605 synthase